MVELRLRIRVLPSTSMWRWCWMLAIYVFLLSPKPRTSSGRTTLGSKCCRCLRYLSWEVWPLIMRRTASGKVAGDWYRRRVILGYCLIGWLRLLPESRTEENKGESKERSSIKESEGDHEYTGRMGSEWRAETAFSVISDISVGCASWGEEWNSMEVLAWVCKKELFELNNALLNRLWVFWCNKGWIHNCSADRAKKKIKYHTVLHLTSLLNSMSSGIKVLLL